MKHCNLLTTFPKPTRSECWFTWQKPYIYIYYIYIYICVCVCVCVCVYIYICIYMLLVPCNPELPVLEWLASKLVLRERRFSTVSNVLNYNIIVSKLNTFTLDECPWKGMKPPYHPPSIYGLNITTTVLLQEWLEGWYAIKHRNQTKPFLLPDLLDDWDG